MKSTNLLVSFAFLAQSWIGSEGLKCYQCNYLKIDDNVLIGTDASCAEGANPDPKFLMDCIGESTGIERTSKSGIGANQQNADGCYTVSANGSRRGSDVESASRGCLQGLTLAEHCETKTFIEWNATASSEPLSRIVWLWMNGFDDDTPVKGCYCKGQGCNGNDTDPGSGSGMTTAISILVIIGLAGLAL